MVYYVVVDDVRQKMRRDDKKLKHQKPKANSSGKSRATCGRECMDSVNPAGGNRPARGALRAWVPDYDLPLPAGLPRLVYNGSSPAAAVVGAESPPLARNSRSGYEGRALRRAGCTIRDGCSERSSDDSAGQVVPTT